MAIPSNGFIKLPIQAEPTPRPLKRLEEDIIPNTQKDAITDRAHHNASDVEDRFWNETSTPHISPSPALVTSSKKSTPPNWNTGKPSIAAATIIGILVFAAICFLSFYYIRRERRARRLRRLQEHNSSRDPFGQSSLSLNAEASKTLDDFLMKDVQPERASLMFSRSRSPSITFLVDDTERVWSNCNSSHASGASSHKLDTLARVSNDRTRWSPRGSEHSPSSLKESQSMLQPTVSISPRASTSSTVPTSPRSSQRWSSTSGTTPATSTEGSSLLSQDVVSPRASGSVSLGYNVLSSESSLVPLPSNASRSSNASAKLSVVSPRSSASISLGSNVLSSESSLAPLPSNASRSSNASSRLSAHSFVRSDPRAIINPGLRRSHARSRSHSLSQSVISPIPESLDSGSAVGSSEHLADSRSTTSPLFRLSDG